MRALGGALLSIAAVVLRLPTAVVAGLNGRGVRLGMVVVGIPPVLALPPLSGCVTPVLWMLPVLLPLLPQEVGFTAQGATPVTVTGGGLSRLNPRIMPIQHIHIYTNNIHIQHIQHAIYITYSSYTAYIRHMYIYIHMPSKL